MIERVSRVLWGVPRWGRSCYPLEGLVVFEAQLKGCLFRRGSLPPFVSMARREVREGGQGETLRQKADRREKTEPDGKVHLKGMGVGVASEKTEK